MKCPGCGERFELDGAALHEAEPELELDLARMPARPAAPAAEEQLATPAPEREAIAPRSPASSPTAGYSFRLSGLLWLLPVLALLLLLGHYLVNSGDRPAFLQLRWTSVGAELASASRVLVFLHGLGGSAAEVEEFAKAMLERSERADLAIVLPEGPLSHRLGRAWFATGDPTERERARAQLVELIRDLSTRYELPPERIYVGGFAQGGGLALEVAQTYPGRLGGAVVLSGCAYPRGAIPPMRLFFGHGRNDPVCPFSVAQSMHKKYAAAGLTPQVAEHDSGHTTPEEVQSAVTWFLVAGMP